MSPNQYGIVKVSKVKQTDIHITLYTESDSSLERRGMAHVNRIDYTVLLVIYTVDYPQME